MVEILKGFIFFKYLSYCLALFVIIGYLKKFFQFRYLSIYLFVSLCTSIFERIVAVQLGSAIPVFHLTLLIRFYLIQIVLNQIVQLTKLNYFFGTIAFIVFYFESIISNNWMKNNEILTVFVNLSLAVISIVSLFKIFQSIKSTLFNYSITVISSFLVISCSSLILSIYESDLRSSQSYAAFFLILFYNLIEISQNFAITYSLWKLKEA
jgi:hypothetical protein